MTAPLFLLDGQSLATTSVGATLLLDGPEGRHAATVQRIGAGEEVLVADGTGRLARCTVTDAARDSLTLAVAELRDVAPPGVPLVLVQALAKGDRDLQAVEAATELGVDEVVPWQAERSIVQWRGERGAKSLRKWEQQARAAAKQARRPTVPAVAPLVRRDELARRVHDHALTLVLHEDADTPLSSVTLPAQGAVQVVVGPEGGITPAELDALTDAGASVVRLGETVLRSSSAGPAALAVLLARTRWA